MRPLIAVLLLTCLTGVSGEADGRETEASALFQAIRNGNAPAVRDALKAGADLQARNEAGDTPLMAAALVADTGILKELLHAGAGAGVNSTNAAGATALMRAATFTDKTRLLVESGADPHARSAMGNTALLLAARQPGNVKTVKLLLDRGADVNATNAFGASALLAAVAAADPEMTRLLLDRGAEVNVVPAMTPDGFLWGGGRTALGWAAFLGHEPLVRLLLARGARADVLSIAGSALTQAGWAGHAGVARLLLDAGAPVDQRDLIANYTPLHWAASSELASPALVELLLARGADANAEGGQPVDNYLGVAQTPLMLARRRGDTPIVRALLRAGARDAATPAGRPRSSGTVAAAPLAAAAAIQRALPTLVATAENSASTFRRHASRQDCISCHQQQLPLAAIRLAASRHLTTDPAVERHQVELLTQFISSTPITPADARFTTLESNLEPTFFPEPAIFNGYASLDFELSAQPASIVTDALVHELATLQAADGHWDWNLPRPPIQASALTATAQAVHTLRSYPIPARRKELQARIRRARSWLLKARAETSEEQVHQLLGLFWAGAKSGDVKARAEALIRRQRPDGGWGQLEGLDSDAYATGQSLYALREAAGIPAAHPSVQRGIAFLLQTQLADGTWHVRSRAHPFQPPMDSGFPHGRDGWISAAGTSWAVMALAVTLDPSQEPTSPPSPPRPAMATEMPVNSPAPTPGPAAPVVFTRDIQPVLERSCLACHGGERPKGGFQLTDRASLLRGGNRGEPVVVPGSPDAGQLIHLVQDEIEDLEMPPLAKRGTFPALTLEEKARLRAWMDQGAVWPEGVTLQAAGR